MRRGVSGPGVGGFRHEAVFYRGLDDLVAATVPFIIEGLDRREPVLVAVLPDRIRRLRSALGRAADRVAFLDLEWVGRNPARIIPVWRRFVRESGSAGPVRGIGEPVWSGRSEVEFEECSLHESLLNVAFDGGPAWRLVCPYDVDALPRDVVQDVMRTHPYLGSAAGVHLEYAGHRYASDGFASKLTPAPASANEAPFQDDLSRLRAVLRTWALDAGLSHRRAADLALAVHELATNSMTHGGGEGVLRGWREPESFVVEVSDTGRIGDPLVGRDVVPDSAEGGRGLWLVNQLCDLVQVRSLETGTVVRLHSRL